MTNRQRIFISEYLKTFNAAESARRAGYKGSAHVVGPRLFADVRIKAEIERQLAERAMQPSEILERLSLQARGDLGEFIATISEQTEDGPLTLTAVDWEKVKAAGLTRLVRKFKMNRRGDMEVELYDAKAAMELLGKHLGMFADDKTITLKVEKELDSILSTLSKELPDDLYQHVLAVLSSGEAGGEAAAPDSSQENALAA